MQTLSNAQRSEKKRPAVETSNHPPTAAAPEPTSQIQSGARTSSGSSRSSTYRKANVCLMGFPFTCWIGFWVVMTSLESSHMTDVVQSLARPTAFPDREECYPSTHSYEAATRNAYTMVTAQCNRGRCLRRLCPSRIRIQHCMPRFQ